MIGRGRPCEACGQSAKRILLVRVGRPPGVLVHLARTGRVAAAKGWENPCTRGPTRRQRLGAIPPAVHAGDVRQAWCLIAALGFALEVARNAPRLACSDLRLGAFTRADQVDAVVPEVLAHTLRLFHELVLLNLREQCHAGVEPRNQACLRAVVGPHMLGGVWPDHDLRLRVPPARCGGHAIAKIRDHPVRTEGFAASAVGVALLHVEGPHEAVIEAFSTDDDHGAVEFGIAAKHAFDTFVDPALHQRVLGAENVLAVGFPGERAPQFRVCDEHGVVRGEFLARVEKSVGLEAVGTGDLSGFQVRFGQAFDAPRGEFGNSIGTRERMKASATTEHGVVAEKRCLTVAAARGHRPEAHGQARHIGLFTPCEKRRGPQAHSVHQLDDAIAHAAGVDTAEHDLIGGHTQGEAFGNFGRASAMIHERDAVHRRRGNGFRGKRFE